MNVSPAMQADAEAFVTWEERAAIREFDGDVEREAAERATKRELGYQPRPREIGILATLGQRMPAS